MVNKVILVGNVGSDPETTSFNSGSSVSKFPLATSYKTKDGDHTDWHSVNCWGKLSDLAKEHIKKGAKMYIEGTLTYETWEDKESGKNMKKAVVNAVSVQFLTPKGEE